MATMRTRMLKAICGDCAYTVRVTRRWLDEAGPPICPCDGHGSMEVPDAASWDQEAWEAAQCSNVVDIDTARTLRDRMVYTRALHDCVHCREEIQRGDYARHRVYTVGAEFYNEYQHFTCAGGNSQGR